MEVLTIIAIIGIFGAIAIPAMVAMKGCSVAGRVINEAGDVAVDELGPRALLKKYMWFKDCAAQLNKKQADIGLYEQRFAVAEKKYGDAPPRHISEQLMLWQTEMLGVKASYNSLAAEYNSAMAKANWSFCNAGSLPAGAVEPLPREFAAYVSQ